MLLINDLLDLAKIEANKLKLSPTNFYLPTFLSEVVNMAQIWTEEKNIHLKFETDANLPTYINVDETILKKTLMNLLSNAVKLTDNGEIILKVNTLEPVSNLSERIRFSVIDGVGMSPQELDKIFNYFEQVGDLKHQAIGTGLGLTISKKLVELMGSTLQVKSELNKGTTFWFDLTV